MLEVMAKHWDELGRKREDTEAEIYVRKYGRKWWR